MKKLIILIEDLRWAVSCSYNLWLHGPYGLARVVERIPFRFIVKYLRRYGATIGSDCRFERGLRIHRPLGKRPFENLVIGNGVYLGHNMLIDLTCRVTIRNKALIGADCQIWTHTGYYENSTSDTPVYREKEGEVIIEEGTIIYSGVIVSYGLTIGRFSRIGAGSLVNVNVDPVTFVGGVPVRKVDNQ